MVTLNPILTERSPVARSDQSSEAGTVAAVRERLLAWITRAPQGLARVEYVSETARAKVVAGLRSALKEQQITLEEIRIPSDRQPMEIIDDFLDQLQKASSGAVSIEGFGALFARSNFDQQKFLYLLNLNRENFARHPLRQIWWLPVHVADLFARTIPDLDSWFLVKLRLLEIGGPDLFESDFVLWDRRTGVSPEDARKRAAALAERFRKGLSEGQSPDQLLEQFAIPAIDALLEADLKEEADRLYGEFESSLASAGFPMYPYAVLKERMLKKAIQDAETHLGPTDPKVADSLSAYVCWLIGHARCNEGLACARRALEIDSNAFGPDHARVAIDLNNLAAGLEGTNRLAEAEPLYRRALAIDEAAFGADHPNVAIRLNNLAALLQATNRLAEAEPLCRRAYSICLASLGPEHPHTQSSAASLRLMEILLREGPV